MNFKNLAIAFSFSHLMLCFFFILPNGNGYMFPTAECSEQIVSFLLFLTILTALFYKLLFSTSNALYAVYILFTYIIFRGVKAMFRFQFGANLKSITFLISISILSILFSYFYLKDRRKISQITKNIILFFAPFGLLTVFKLSTDLIELKKNVSLKQYQANNENNKIFWIIFDELDQYLIFENPNRPFFSELEKLKNESIYASKAIQPGSCTNISLPAFTTGLTINDVVLNGASHLKLLLKNGSTTDWRKTPNIFQKASALGYNSSLIGWYHPYDRIFSSDVAYIALEDSFFEKKKLNKFRSVSITFINQIFSFFHYNFDKLFQISLKKSLIPKEAIKIKSDIRNEQWYGSLLTKMEEVIDNDKLNFNFFHLPIPHYPTCYNSKTNKIANASPNYYENVYLVDKTLSWLREKLSQKNLWESSIIIVTSDHWLRTEKGFVDQYVKEESEEFKASMDKRKAPYVPILIKMPNQSSNKEINKEINSLIIHDLVLDIMKKKIKTSDDVLKTINDS